jgi:hypothetical protein
MLSNRLFFVAAACAFPLSFVACGGDSEEAPIIPAGTHYGYVVSKATAVVATGHSPTELGLDLGSKTSSKPDGKIDNQLGNALQTLAGLMFDVQGSIDTAVDHGNIILLLDFQTKDFVNTGNAGITMKFGANPVPAACGTGDTTCGKHLKGDATFTIATGSPNDPPLGGTIVNGTFNSQAGDLTLQIAIGTSTAPIEMNLVHARVKATSISETGIMSANLGGLLLQTDLMTKVAPSLQAQVSALLTTCTDLTVPPDCGCTGNTKLLLQTLDGDNGTPPDCMISVEEVLSNKLIKPLLSPDACSKDSCSTPDALSLGLKVEAVKATFPL